MQFLLSRGLVQKYASLASRLEVSPRTKFCLLGTIEKWGPQAAHWTWRTYRDVDEADPEEISSQRGSDQYYDIRSTCATRAVDRRELHCPKMSSSDQNFDCHIRVTNPLLTIDERNDARQSIAKVEAELQRIETDIAKLLERQEEVTDSLSQLKKTLVIHRILPGETIGYIFSILRAEKVSIPHKRPIIPPQITVSHVCSKWREIALATPALWSNVEFMRPNSNHWVHVALELLFDRAGTRGVNIVLNLEEIGPKEMGKILYDIVLPLHVKTLHLTLPLATLGSLSQESDGIITNIDEIALSIAPCSSLVPIQSNPSTSGFGGFSTFGSSSNQVPIASNPAQVSVAPQFLSRIRSLIILRRGSQGSFIRQLDLQNLPWTQMRYLNCGTCTTVSTIYDILRQSPVLEVCEIKVKLDDATETTSVLTLPRLRIFHIFPDHDSPHSDTVLRSFQCPNLTDFRLKILHWTPETHKIIENHYNLHQLLKLEVTGYPYPISKVLVDAPMLQELVITDKAFMDEKALQGIASGKLGRRLTSLGFLGNFNVRRVLDMVVSRQRRMKQVVEASRSWQDPQISGIKRMFVLNDAMENCALVEEFKGKADELEELKVVVYNPCEGLGLGSEELAWPGNLCGLSWQNVCDFPQSKYSGSKFERSLAPLAATQVTQPTSRGNSTIEPSLARTPSPTGSRFDSTLANTPKKAHWLKNRK